MLRLKPGPAFRNVSADFFTPAQWQQYDIQVDASSAFAWPCAGSCMSWGCLHLLQVAISAMLCILCGALGKDIAA